MKKGSEGKQEEFFLTPFSFLLFFPLSRLEFLYVSLADLKLRRAGWPRTQGGLPGSAWQVLGLKGT